MGIGVSVFLIAAGAILTFAINATVSGVSLDVIGWILMGAGALGLIWALIAAGTGRGADERVSHREVVHH